MARRCLRVRFVRARDFRTREGGIGRGRRARDARGHRAGDDSTDERARVVARAPRADGGMQEFEAAKAAILNVRPNANVVANRVDKYPITVTVSSGGKDVWSGRQQGLFRKNGRPAMKEIEDAMRGLQ